MYIRLIQKLLACRFCELFTIIQTKVFVKLSFITKIMTITAELWHSCYAHTGLNSAVMVRKTLSVVCHIVQQLVRSSVSCDVNVSLSGQLPIPFLLSYLFLFLVFLFFCAVCKIKLAITSAFEHITVPYRIDKSNHWKSVVNLSTGDVTDLDTALDPLQQTASEQ